MGETCERKRRVESGGAAVDRFTANITCGKSGAIVGAVTAAPLQLPADEQERRALIERVAKSGRAGVSIAARMECSAGAWLSVEGGADALLLPCALRDGNWPQLVLFVAADRKLYVGEGLPSLLPVVEAAISRATEKPLRFSDAASDIARLEGELKRPLPVFGADEFGNYRDLMRAARLDNSRQDFAAAESAERRALDIQTRLFGTASAGAGEALMALALDVSNQGRFDEAAALFRRAETVIEGSPDTLERGRLASYRALDAANRGRYDDALKFAKESTALRRSDAIAGIGQATDVTSAPSRANDYGEVAHSLIIEAAMALRVNDLPSAEAAATDALRIIASTRGLPLWWRAEALIMMGDINAREERFPAAERDYLDAIAFRERIFGETAPTSMAHMTLGRLYVGEERYPEAILQFQSALTILAHNKAARAELTPEQITPFIAAAMAQAARDPAQRASLEEDIFRTAQLLGGGVAAQTVARTSARLAARDPTASVVLREVQDIERKRDGARLELAAETAKPDTERSGRREAELASDVKTASAAADTMMRQFLDQFPSYARLLEPGAVALGDLRNSLLKGEALLSFVVGHGQSYALLVQPGEFTVRPIKIDDAQLAADVSELRQAFEPRGAALPPFDLRASYGLYQKLLGPLADRLTETSHLVVVASGPLASLPLGLLVERPPAPGTDHDYAKAAWLARRIAISEVPSVQAFLALRTAAALPLAPARFLGFGDPAFAGRQSSTIAAGRKDASALGEMASRCRDDRPASAQLLRALPPLPDTATEVRTVGRLLGADPAAIRLGAEATEAAFRGAHPERYRVLYFATHGLLPGELQCQTEPALVLSPPTAPAVTKAEDGLLEASEIAALKLDADLVVLSACNTAAPGGRFGGEALSGLAEAFFYAGARTLLASHWQVPSGATTKLMTDVFERVGPDLSHGVADSLRRAQLDLLDKPATGHPFFWAAFTVIGDGAEHDRARGTVAQAAIDR
ncbi:MAG TPA: CHAT domain-containing tetratricopeptide repeat protein [Stellaceae bacterium]|nr:CHAT domain-containing tetratricopeptide repeat protein [Stellaceae bacterium]